MKNELKVFHRLTEVSKFCMNAGFLSVAEIGQYFMTKDTGKQFCAKACREYTPSKEMMDHHIQKDGFREIQKLDPY